jgi:hypothetical protein
MLKWLLRGRQAKRLRALVVKLEGDKDALIHALRESHQARANLAAYANSVAAATVLRNGGPITLSKDLMAAADRAAAVFDTTDDGGLTVRLRTPADDAQEGRE